MTQTINFQATTDSIEKFENVLRQNGLGLSIAQVHGTLAGLVCLGHSKGNFQQWSHLLIPGHPTQSLLDTIFTLIYFTHDSLESTEFKFRPILCSASDLLERVESLGAWCLGFSVGLELNSMKQTTTYSEDAEHFLSDISEISLVEASTDDDESERAFYELEEYVKVGVQLIYEEFSSSALVNTTAG